MSKPKTNALVTLTTLKPEKAQIGTARANLDVLIERAESQYRIIKQGERDGALRAIFLGLLFWQIKNEAGHGKFMSLATERLPEISQRTRQDYMKLALAFVDKTRCALPEHMDVPDAQMALNVGDAGGVQGEIVRKAVDFVGGLSIFELLVKHDIRAVGLKKELSEGNDEPDPTLPPDEALRRRRDEIFGTTIEHLGAVRKYLTNTEHLTLLDNTQLEAIESKLVELRAAIAAVRKTA